MKRIILSSILTLTSFAVCSQFYVKNNFDKPYKVAVAFFDSSYRFSGWVSMGWMEVLPGEEKEVFFENPKEKFIYYHAVSETDTIKGYKKVLVHPNEAFTIIHAILKATKEQNPSMEWFQFKEVKRGIATKRKKQYTLILGQ